MHDVDLVSAYFIVGIISLNVTSRGCRIESIVAFCSQSMFLPYLLKWVIGFY